ncbi:RNA-binding transcriptional accessory protein [Lysinibacillus sphaericus]|uniref:RNA-binding transcriptional accessory protein n=2 Tax=Lysinibacillus sphaericus TaxID=1421 RepID=A0A2S0JWE2_LYSSH|nr:Tex family protein [Lysinibacillus sphaericus]AVK95264.1 RNA-binding transcriptional accessory protein [Lysinibacillus sphaericus]MED4545091.1 Tex family protein [Lysinibacillus sphaericus]TKI18561.1 RNA-binding transcriptional accessory protein [Lysinibacillus sphaericus]GEC84162.1 RNA-binding transcriptional accessory protein [Lysinibacillus sphaericus]
MEQKQMYQLIAKDIAIKPNQAEAVIKLLDEGNTVPFIARYRKEATGSLDEVQIKAVEDRYHYIQQLEQRKEEVLRLIQEQDKLTPELEQAIQVATVLQRVEDLYRPYKQKRRTKATIAKEKGLEPLADLLLEYRSEALVQLAQDFVDMENVATVEDAIAGARDILAERFADDASIRQKIRTFSWKEGMLTTALKNAELDEKKVFEMYYEYEEPVNRIVPHRILAVNRGEKEDVLKVAIQVPIDRVLMIMWKEWIPATGFSPAIAEVKLAIEDSYKRLIQPSIERELRNELTEKAEAQAIHIFSENLRNLLLQPPLKGKYVLGVDPAYRTGCKLAVVDETGKMLEVTAIYPHPPKPDVAKSKAVVKEILAKYPITIIAIGNGTASRETEQFIADVLSEVNTDVAYVIVNEAGASVYSASEVARAEFPDLQVEQRSAVSIARRLQDPLSELVKIEPKAVGVGQYQHDVSQKKLSESLTFIVETAVNQVGVDVNTASASLLQYVSGLSKTVAENIVKVREENGQFTTRAQLKKIPRLGAKTYEQAIGFLRVPEAKNPFDATGIHPESYNIAEQILDAAHINKKELGTQKAEEAIAALNVQVLSESLGIGVVTVQDIVDTLMKPSRDPRDAFPQPLLKTDVLKMEDLQVGMELQGTVRNVVDFGAFVDIGVKQDGLVHISKLQKKRIKHPLEVVALGDIVTVWVEQIDVNKGRISLTMLPPEKQMVEV